MGFRLEIKPLELLTEEQVGEIHRSTLQVLWRTGIRIESDWALDFFEKHDCKVDHNSLRVRFPGDLVDECLRQVPRSFRVKARNPNNDLKFGVLKNL